MKALIPILIVPLLTAASVDRCGGGGEPNDSAATATQLDPGDAGVVARGALTPGDVDWYALPLRAGEVLTVSLEEDGDGAFHDAVLGVFRPGEERPAAADDDGGPGFLPRLAVPVDVDGLWHVAVGGFGDAALDGGDHEERFAYRLVLGVVADPPLQVDPDEAGIGDDEASPQLEADLLARGVAVLVGRLVPGDVDRFRLPLTDGAVLTASVFDDARGAFHDAVLRVDSEGGDRLAEDDDAGPGFLPNLVLRSGREGEGVLSLTGFDDDPDDGLPHEQRFVYRLVLSLETPAR